MTDSSHRASTDPFLVTAEGSPTLSRMQARHPEYLLTSRGVRLPSSLAAVDTMRWRAALLPLRPESVLSHTSAAQAHRLPIPRSSGHDRRVHVTTPRDCPRPRRRDLVTHHASLTSVDICTIDGLRLTSPARTYVDMAALLPFDHLVALGDVVLRHGLADRELLLDLARSRSRYPGRGRAIAAIAWLDPAAASPRESQLRVLLRRAKLPSPEVNGVITDDAGGFLAVGDLVFRRERVIVEYDGEVHAPMAQRAKDAARRAVLREHGWIVVEIVGDDMRYPARVVARVRAALADALTRGRR